MKVYVDVSIIIKIMFYPRSSSFVKVVLNGL